MRPGYYYFISSLPSLQLGVKAPISLEQFLNQAQEQLSSRDHAELTTVLQSLQSGPQAQIKNLLVKNFLEFEHNLRNESAWVRALEANKDPQLFIRGPRTSDARFVDIVARALQANLLEGEHILDEARWMFLEEISRFCYFSFENVVVYALKLRMLERYEQIESPRGKELFAEYKKVEIPTVN